MSSLLCLGFFLAISSCTTLKNDDGEEQTLHVELSEWAIKPDRQSVAPGKIRFKAVNRGTLPHEVVVIKTDEPLADFKVSKGKVLEEAVGEVMGEIESFPAGSAQALTLTLSEGNYVLFCNNLEADKHEGHYEQGMRIGLTVKADLP